jgi:pectate lyase
MHWQLTLRLGALLVCIGGCLMAGGGCARYDYNLGGLPASSSGGASGAGEPGGGGETGVGGNATGGEGGVAGSGTGGNEGVAGSGTGGAGGVAGSGTGGAGGVAGSGTGGDEGVGGSGTGGLTECPLDLQGWATISGDGVATTTGGGDTTPVRPTSDQELMDFASDGMARVIEIDGTFNVPRLQVASNKTLIGIGPNATINGGIRIRGTVDDNVSNVILRNVNVNGATTDADGDAVHIYYAHHVWVDHCEMWDGVDSNLDVVHASNWVTISWTIFRHSSAAAAREFWFSNLFGHSDDNAGEDDGRLKITAHHNWWREGITEHMPRVRFGQVHIYNNYYSSSGNNDCIRAGTNAHILSESNYFYQVAQPHSFHSDVDEATSSITERDNVYDATTGANASGGGGTPFTTPPYSAPIDSANDVPVLVQTCAGPQ